jgi:hypothetical protein
MVVKNPSVSYETVFKIISNAGGPREQIEKYLSLIDDIEKRREYALKYKFVNIVIDVRVKRLYYLV